MPGKTAVGGKIYIGSANSDPTAVELTDFQTDTYTKIGRSQSFGELGDALRVVEWTELEEARVLRQTSFKDGGEFTFMVTFDPTDTGQAALIASIGTDHNFKLELDDAGAGSPSSPTTFYFVGLCTSNRRALGDGSAVVTRNVPLQVQSDLFEVAAT